MRTDSKEPGKKGAHIVWDIRDARGLSGNEKSVLYALASRGEDIRPGRKTLAADAGVSTGTVHKIITGFVASGLVVKQARRGDTNRYTINRAALSALIPAKHGDEGWVPPTDALSSTDTLQCRQLTPALSATDTKDKNEEKTDEQQHIERTDDDGRGIVAARKGTSSPEPAAPDSQPPISAAGCASASTGSRLQPRLHVTASTTMQEVSAAFPELYPDEDTFTFVLEPAAESLVLVVTHRLLKAWPGSRRLDFGPAMKMILSLYSEDVENQRLMIEATDRWFREMLAKDEPPYNPAGLYMATYRSFVEEQSDIDADQDDADAT